MPTKMIPVQMLKPDNFDPINDMRINHNNKKHSLLCRKKLAGVVEDGEKHLDWGLWDSGFARLRNHSFNLYQQSHYSKHDANIR